MSDDFYIGYLDEMPRRLGKWISWMSIFLIAMTAIIAVVLVRNQPTLYPSSFEFGTVRSYEGVYIEHPAPSIIVQGENNTNEQTTYLLVNEGKFGFSPDDPEQATAPGPGSIVRLDGTLIRRDDVRMLEVVKGSLQMAFTEPSTSIPDTEYIGERYVTGEIVGSKCFLGVMNPGDETVHRACARLCIRGGIPPMLHLDTALEDLDTAEDGVRYVLITGENGKSINEQILPYVASPVGITGELFRTEDLYELRISTGAIIVLN